MNLGFIGTGTMGAPIARHVLTGEGALTVFDAVEASVQPLVGAGAARARSIAELASSCNLIFLSLPGPPEIEEVVVGASGILEHCAAGTTVVDLSTNSVALVRSLADQCASRGSTFVDAPISGGAKGAEEATLSVMIGASDEAYACVHPFVRHFAASVFHVGPSGAGAIAKLVNNQIFLCTSIIVQEGFVLGAKAGMDANDLLEILKASSANTVLAGARLTLSRNFENVIFKLGIAVKDIAVALESARALGVAMPGTEAAYGVYESALEEGYGDEVFTATLKVLERQAETEVARLERRERS